MKKTIPFWLMAMLLLFIGCRGKEPQESSRIQRPVVTGVTFITISPSSVDSFYETSGTVKAGTTSIVASRTMGNVLAVRAREGARVKAGEVLVTLDDRDLAEKVAQAEAANKEALKSLDVAEQNKNLAEVTSGRYRNLYAEKVITQQEMDQIETQKKVAAAEYERLKEMVQRTRASVEEAKIYRGFSRVTAPVSGVITEKKVDPGSLAAPGMPLLTIEDTSHFKVEAYVDERLAPKIKPGTGVYVFLEATGDRIPGIIGEVVPAIDPASRSFLIKIPVKGPGIKSGLYCRVQIPEGKKETILVPRKAVVERGQLTGVYVVDDQRVVTFRLIRTGKTFEDKIEVLSGLRGGEQVAVEGIERAVDGGMVKQ
jgi:RND family efflux transporter MFP subunit